MQQLDLQDTDLFQTDKGKRFTQANTNDRATSSKWKFSIWIFWEVLSLLVILKGLFFLIPPLMVSDFCFPFRQ